MTDTTACLSFHHPKQVTQASFEQHTSPPYIYLQVSFRGNIPQAEEETLSVTVVGKKNLSYYADAGEAAQCKTCVKTVMIPFCGSLR